MFIIIHDDITQCKSESFPSFFTVFGHQWWDKVSLNLIRSLNMAKLTFTDNRENADTCQVVCIYLIYTDNRSPFFVLYHLLQWYGIKTALPPTLTFTPPDELRSSWFGPVSNYKH